MRHRCHRGRAASRRGHYAAPNAQGRGAEDAVEQREPHEPGPPAPHGVSLSHGHGARVGAGDERGAAAG